MAANKALRRLVKRIEGLKSEINSLINSLNNQISLINSLNNQMYEIENRANRRIRESDYERQQAEERERDRNYEFADLTKKLERAKQNRDSYECDRLIRKMKCL